MKNTIKSVIAATLLVGFASAVQAVPTVTGDIFIGAHGSYATIDTTGNTVHFVDTAPLILGNAQVNNASGDFALLIDAPVTYADFTYSPLPVGGVNPLWTLTLGGASFDLTSITSINEASGLILHGLGTIHLAGFADTDGAWSFSADSTDGGATFNFSSTTTTNVPDGGTTVMLLGGALAGLGLLRKKLVA